MTHTKGLWMRCRTTGIRSQIPYSSATLSLIALAHTHAQTNVHKNTHAHTPREFIMSSDVTEGHGR